MLVKMHGSEIWYVGSRILHRGDLIMDLGSQAPSEWLEFLEFFLFSPCHTPVHNQSPRMQTLWQGSCAANTSALEPGRRRSPSPPLDFMQINIRIKDTTRKEIISRNVKLSCSLVLILTGLHSISFLIQLMLSGKPSGQGLKHLFN